MNNIPFNTCESKHCKDYPSTLNIASFNFWLGWIPAMNDIRYTMNRTVNPEHPTKFQNCDINRKAGVLATSPW